MLLEKGRKKVTVCRVSSCHEALRACVVVGGKCGKCALQVVVRRQLWCSGRQHAGTSALSEHSIGVLCVEVKNVCGYLAWKHFVESVVCWIVGDIWHWRHPLVPFYVVDTSITLWNPFTT